jgi:hypothetical protein
VQGVSKLRGKLVRTKLPPLAMVTDFGCDARGLKRPWSDREWSETRPDGIRITTVASVDLRNWQSVGLGKTFPQSLMENGGTHRHPLEQDHYLQ